MAKGGKRTLQRPPPRSRTRQHKPKLTDPDRTEVELGAQLATLGLALRNTIGDGNCLFRALSDQLYGTEGYHLPLRAEITNWMAAHPERYSGFVEDDRGFENHLRCMREPGTYGGHLELSAFAHLKRKNVKVIQPGLVYVIEWDTGAPLSPSGAAASGSDNELPTPSSPTMEREQRRARRDKVREGKKEKEPVHHLGDTVYVAYHDWEHFSSVRTLSGQLPLQAMVSVSVNVEEVDVPIQEMTTITSASPLSVRRPRGRPRKHPVPLMTPISPALLRPVPSSPTTTITAPTPIAPIAVPLPHSPSPSTNSSADDSNSASSTTLSHSTATSSRTPLTPSDSATALHLHLHDPIAKGRSPKRTIEAADDMASDGSDTRGAKRRAGVLSVIRSNLSARGDLGTPPLSHSSSMTPCSSRPPPSCASSVSVEMEDDGTSELSSLEDEEEMVVQEDAKDGAVSPPGSESCAVSTSTSTPGSILSTPSKTRKLTRARKKGNVNVASKDTHSEQLTRRQRKQLGLPKPRLKRVILTVNGKRPPGAGPRTGESSDVGASAEGGRAEHEWVKNGSGRLDMRGFKELKI